jgi:hypothetical protein
MERLYSRIAQVLLNQKHYEKSINYCNTVVNWADKGLIDKHQLADVYCTLSSIAYYRKQFNK